MRRSTIGLVLALAVIAACGGSDDTSSENTVTTDDTGTSTDDTNPDDTSTDDTSTDESDDIADDGTDDSRTTDDGTTDDAEPAESTIVDEADAPAEPVRPFPWLADLPLLTEPSDDLRPLLAWGLVDGAVLYSITVTAPTGAAYWAWQTDATSVHLGGDPRLDDDQSGPSTVPGMTWSVIAFDGDGRPLAASVEAVLRP